MITSLQPVSCSVRSSSGRCTVWLREFAMVHLTFLCILLYLLQNYALYHINRYVFNFCFLMVMSSSFPKKLK